MGKLKAFIHSIKFRILAVIMIVGVVPMMLISFGTMYIFNNAVISSRTIDIQSQISRVAKLIGDKGQYLNRDADLLQSEIERLSDIYDGRILIVNNQLRIVLDTYVFEEGKTLTSENIVNVMNGKKKSLTITNPEYIEMITPITSQQDKNILGVIIVMMTTSDVTSVITQTNSVMYIFRIILLALTAITAVFCANMLVKPFNSITNSLKRYSNGYEDERITVSGYTETEILTESFNKMLDKMQKLDASRQEFVSNVSHELKTPITSIKVLADSINGQEEVPVEIYREFMEDIVVEIDRENKIINDLLELVRLDRTNAVLNITTVNINNLLELMLRRLRPIAGTKNIDMTFESFRPVTAEVDEVKLTLAVSNLVENAIKYNIENGWVKVSLNADHQYFYVKVEDSGIGIPQEAQEKIFERFYRVDKARSRETGGTGLGLSIVKNIIVMHKGSIKLYSKEDEGTTFTIRIPLSYVS
jgi:signal transduction histidine kinase